MSYSVLIVEDEELIRKGLLISVEWERMGCLEVLEATNGEEALHLIESRDFDIVLMDINIPVITGLDVISRTHESRNYIPIILTGYAQFELAKRAMSLGVDNYLLKPVHFDELEEAIIHAEEECDRRKNYLRYKLSALNTKTVLDENRSVINPAVAQMIQYIDEHYSERVNLYEIATLIHYSETFLTRKFKAEMNMTFSEYLNRYRIRKAMQLIACDGEKLTDIAEKCGFSEYNYFNGVFKKYVGCTPKEYRNEIK